MAEKKGAGRSGAPARAALAQLADLASRGVAPDRARRAVESIVDVWRAEATGHEERVELRERLWEMCEELAEGVDAASEAIEEMDRSETAAITASLNALTALTAALGALRSSHASIRFSP